MPRFRILVLCLDGVGSQIGITPVQIATSKIKGKKMGGGGDEEEDEEEAD